MLFGFALDQCARALGAGFLIGVEQQRDLTVLPEIELLQDLHGVQPRDDAALVVHHAGAVGALVLDVEGFGAGGAVLEHGVHVRHQQDARFARAFPGGEDIVARGRRRGDRFHLCPGLAQFVDDDRADLAEPRLVAGARVDVHETLEQLQRIAAIVLRGGQYLEVGVGMRQRRGA